MSIDDFHSTPVYAISVVAQLTGMHPQTLRQYDRLGLVSPSRTTGGGRRYSARDVDRLREIQQLSSDGIGLAGVKRVLELDSQVDALRLRVANLEAELSLAHAAMQQQSKRTGHSLGTDLVLRDSSAVVVWCRPRPPLG